MRTSSLVLCRGGAVAAATLLSFLPAWADNTQLPLPGPAATRTLGGSDWSGWTGLAVKPGESTAAFSVPGEAVYRVPDSPLGSHIVAAHWVNDRVLNARPWYGLRFEIDLERAAPFHLDLTASIPVQTGRMDLPPSTSAQVTLQGRGWQTVTIPFAAFDFNRGQFGMLGQLKEIAFKGRYDGESAGKERVLLRNIRLVRGDVLHLESEIRSKPDGPDGTVSYPLTVTNCTDKPLTIALTLQRQGWEGMPAILSPISLTLAPGESGAANLKVTVPASLPGGIRETQTVVATAQGSGVSEKIEFVTSRRLPYPYLLFPQAGWDALKVKVAKYDWARKELDRDIAVAERWQVPSQGRPGIFPAYSERELWPTAIAYKLTGNRAYAEKVALFLRRLSDPEKGFPTTLKGNAADIPQEGGLWEGSARAYEAIYDSGVLSEQDKRQIEQSFRIYIRLQVESLPYGGISNWSVFNLSPASQCALLLQDMDSFHRLVYDTGGLVDHLRYGTMDDGWWYEMSLSYNLGVAEAYTNLGIAARPFGIDLLNEKFPASTSRFVGLRPFEYQKFLGMEMHKFGPLRDNWISIRKMWDGIVPYPDYRSVMFGMGDGHEEVVGGGRFDLAYYAYHDPAYAAIIKQSAERNLIWGVPDLPAETPKPYTLSAHADDAGIAVLRSQTAGRPPREQIQVSHKYGTHGSYHGHFDRLSLNSLERYGISFYNPETSWFGYPSYMYKWWVQPSISHNMVVVDGKMQEPVESTPLLFHSGPMMQVSAVENNARWSNPPYFGGYEQIEDVRRGDKPYGPVPENHPKPGDVTAYTEPVRNRRAIIVTDDYVVLADDLRGKDSHTFDNLLQLRGAALTDSEKVKPLPHEEQFDANPLSSGQFITNVDRYEVSAPAVIRSLHHIAGQGERNTETGGQNSRSEPGDLHIDAHALWPPQAELRIGDYAENWPVSKKLTYSVEGDGKALTSGTFGAWILGRGTVDIDVTGLKELRLTTQVERGRDTLNTTFWGNAAVVTADGKTIPLSQLKTITENILPVPTASRDYGGGPVRIAGIPCADVVAAEPRDPRRDATLTLELSGLNAVRFRAIVGGDWPVGREDQVRKVTSIRTTGTIAHYLTLIEPYEGKSIVRSAVATGPNTLRVELADGRVQELIITGLEGDGKSVRITLTETRDGKIVRQEEARN